MKISKHKKDIVHKILSSNKSVFCIPGGAGSGKSSLISYLVSEIIRRKKNASILNLAFAKETTYITEKIMEEVNESHNSSIETRTIHSYSRSCLFRYKNHIIPHKFLTPYGYPNKSISFNESWTLIDDTRIKKIWNNEICPGQDTSYLIREHTMFVLGEESRKEKIKKETIEYIKKYQRYKIKNKLYDFSDMLIFFLGLIREHRWIRKELSSEIDYLLCDEAQDIDTVSFNIIARLKGENTKLVFVGDIMQRAYGFIGAADNIFQKVAERFKGKIPVYKLSKNYRSTKRILNLANAVVSQANNKYAVMLKPNKKTMPGSTPKLVSVTSVAEQTDYVVKRIKRHSSKTPYSEIAVCSRVVKGPGPVTTLKQLLKKEGIPFYTKPFVKKAKKLCELIIQVYKKKPKDLSKEVLTKLLTTIENVGAKKAEKIIQDFRRSGIAGVNNRKARKILKNLESTGTLKSVYELLLMKNKDNDMLEDVYEFFKRKIKAGKSLENWSESFERKFYNNHVLVGSIHGIKGDEKEIIFLIAADAHSIPYDDDSSKYEEERCLMNIAITRAKEVLYITYVKPQRKGVYMSPFLEEIEHLKVFKKRSTKRAIITTSATKPLCAVITKRGIIFK